MIKKIVSLVVVLSILFPALKGVAEENIQLNWIEGPTKVTLGNNLATLNVPEAFLYLDSEDTVTYNEYIGNPETGLEIGMIMPKDNTQDWFIVFEYEEVGHIEDNGGENIDADALLQSFKEGTEEQNKIREENGYGPMKVLGWEKEPFYDKDTHNLTWSLAIDFDGEEVLNYNTRILSREGYVSAILVADSSQMDMAVPMLNEAIQNFSFTEGNRYQDFNEETDKAANYGLTALIAGGAGAAAVKTGLFAKLLIFLKKFFYVFIIIGGALFAWFKKRFKKAKGEPEPSTEPEKEAI